jgi:hypothetical protein
MRKIVYTLLAAASIAIGMGAQAAPALAAGHTVTMAHAQERTAHVTPLRKNPINISNSSCRNETFNASLVNSSSGDFLRVQWASNGCGWWLWPKTHCENPKIGTDQGYAYGGHVQSLTTASGTRPKCTNGNEPAVNWAQWHHSCNCGTTYTIQLAPGIKTTQATLDAYSARRVSQSGHLKESFGAGYYVGTPSLTYGSTVSEELGGRLMAFHSDGTYCAPDGNCYTRGTLAFTSGTNTCAEGIGDAVEVSQCSGIFGIEWAEKIVNSHIHFINTHESTAAGADIFMGGLGCGCPLVLGRDGQPSGVLQAWDFL